MEIKHFTTKEAQRDLKGFLDEIEKGSAVMIRKMMISRIYNDSTPLFNPRHEDVFKKPIKQTIKTTKPISKKTVKKIKSVQKKAKNDYDKEVVKPMLESGFSFKPMPKSKSTK